MSLTLAANVADIAGQGPASVLFGVCDIISNSANAVRFNKEAATALATRIHDIVSALTEEHAVGGFEPSPEWTAGINNFKWSCIEILDHVQVLNTALESVTKAVTAPSFPAQRLEPPPAYYFGRTAETESAVTMLDSDLSAYVAILGGPGMGKTSLARAILHHPALTTRFGPKRYFVACDAADSRMTLLSLLSSAFGIATSSGSAAKRALESVLHGPSLLVLDNFESAWESQEQRQETEDVLEFLAGINGLSVMITLRGSERPHGVAWTIPHLPPLATLGSSFATQLFVTISDIDKANPDLLKLLACTDNIPLAIVLLANLAQYESSHTLLARWEEQKTAMLHCSDGSHRLTSMDVSLNVSRSISVLLQTALAVWNNRDQLYVLAPIREFMLSKHYPQPTGLAALFGHYWALAHLINPEGQESSGPAAVALQGDRQILWTEAQSLYKETGNIVGIIDTTLRLSDFEPPEQAIKVSEAMYTIAKDARHLKLGMTKLKEAIPFLLDAQCYGRLGQAEFQIAESCIVMQMNMKALVHIRQALYAFRNAHNVRGQISCFHSSVMANLAVRDTHTALGAIESGETLLADGGGDLSTFSRALWLHVKGAFAAASGDLEAANSFFKGAIMFSRFEDSNEAQENYLQLEGMSLHSLGKLEQAKGNQSEAENCFIVSVTISRRLFQPDLLQSLTYLAQVLENEAATDLLAAIMPPLLHSGLDGPLADAFLTSAGIALRQSNTRLAQHRVQSAMRYLEEVDTVKLHERAATMLEKCTAALTV
ncbi:hypothetical protein EXIGLDRAFT_820815 [Exidia glandulosa HHB12029]|uniref:Novel STAND NTPase 1 domain-containing protein n=1 Tax=Exidia glandulosa HHB12029 TaxID=1314781 RepID=A0A165JTZ4_EXIGL|nr:hypothetical protein EXIGLDRAFT_820815 [Exidia glandulosa HHB12029]